MADEKRYFWLKLQHDFFSSKRIKKLKSLENGDTLVIIYIKMQLSAVKTNGVLEYTGIEETLAEEIALDIDEAPENVETTLNFLLSRGLMEQIDDSHFLLPYVADNTGGETAAAQRMREHRSTPKEQSSNNSEQCSNNSEQSSNFVTESKSKSKSKSKSDNTSPAKPPKSAYGVNNNVRLTDEQKEKLEREFGEEKTKDAIDFLDSYIAEKGYKSKEHYLSIRRWVFDAVEEQKAKAPKKDPWEEADRYMREKYGDDI